MIPLAVLNFALIGFFVYHVFTPRLIMTIPLSINIAIKKTKDRLLISDGNISKPALR